MKRTNDGRSDRLEDALASLIQNQAALLQNQSSFLSRISEMHRVNSDRFARIEASIETILRVLAEHSRLLTALPEAVCEKIGFKKQQ